MDTPFEIGSTYYLAKHHCTRVTVPCPVCYGACKVTVILGNGEHVDVECEACSVAFGRSSGCVERWNYEPQSIPFTIKSVTSMHESEDKTTWYLKSTQGDQAEWSSLHMTSDQAMDASIKHMHVLVDSNARSTSATNRTMLKKKTWSIQYHEQCIRDFQEKIEWHRNKVSERRRCL